MKAKTKREFVLELCSRSPGQRLTGRDITWINGELVKAFGSGGRLSGAEIAQIARSAGREIDYFDLVSFDEDERYEADFAGVLKFDSLAAAETSIRAIHALYEKYEAAQDQAGVLRAREAARRGKHWAQVIAKNTRVKPEKRAQKAEVAEWFALWLRTPDLFDSWVELRKRQLSKEHPEWLAAPAEPWGDEAEEAADLDYS